MAGKDWEEIYVWYILNKGTHVLAGALRQPFSATDNQYQQKKFSCGGWTMASSQTPSRSLLLTHFLFLTVEGEKIELKFLLRYITSSWHPANIPGKTDLTWKKWIYFQWECIYIMKSKTKKQISIFLPTCPFSPRLTSLLHFYLLYLLFTPRKVQGGWAMGICGRSRRFPLCCSPFCCFSLLTIFSLLQHWSFLWAAVLQINHLLHGLTTDCCSFRKYPLTLELSAPWFAVWTQKKPILSF